MVAIIHCMKNKDKQSFQIPIVHIECHNNIIWHKYCAYKSARYANLYYITYFQGPVDTEVQYIQQATKTLGLSQLVHSCNNGGNPECCSKQFVMLILQRSCPQVHRLCQHSKPIKI